MDRGCPSRRAPSLRWAATSSPRLDPIPRNDGLDSTLAGVTCPHVGGPCLEALWAHVRRADGQVDRVRSTAVRATGRWRRSSRVHRNIIEPEAAKTISLALRQCTFNRVPERARARDDGGSEHLVVRPAVDHQVHEEPNRAQVSRTVQDEEKTKKIARRPGLCQEPFPHGRDRDSEAPPRDRGDICGVAKVVDQSLGFLLARFRRALFGLGWEEDNLVGFLGHARSGPPAQSSPAQKPPLGIPTPLRPSFNRNLHPSPSRCGSNPPAPSCAQGRPSRTQQSRALRHHWYTPPDPVGRSVGTTGAPCSTTGTPLRTQWDAAWAPLTRLAAPLVHTGGPSGTQRGHQSRALRHRWYTPEDPMAHTRRPPARLADPVGRARDPPARLAVPLTRPPRVVTGAPASPARP